MEEPISFKKVFCLEMDALETTVVEETNKGSWDEVHDFVKTHSHASGIWVVVPFKN